MWRSVRRPPYAYHRRYVSDTEELYDLTTDPGELEDLSASHPEETARLRALEEAVAEWEVRKAEAINALLR